MVTLEIQLWFIHKPREEETSRNTRSGKAYKTAGTSKGHAEIDSRKGQHFQAWIPKGVLEGKPVSVVASDQASILCTEVCLINPTMSAVLSCCVSVHLFIHFVSFHF